MKKLILAFASIVFISILLIIGCDTRSPSGSGTQGGSNVASVDLQIPPLFKAPSGSQTVTITAVAKDANGVGVSGIALEFMLNPGYGSIASQDSLTDTFGELSATYQVNLQASLVEQITVRVANSNIEDTGALTINLLDQIIQSINIDAVNQVLYIGSQVSVSDTLVTTVIDTSNNGISGIYVNLSTTYGSITNIDTTNLSGQVYSSITFSNDDIPSTQNAISTWIVASVGGKKDSTQITVVRQQTQPTSLDIVPNPDYMQLASTTQGQSIVKAYVTDAGGNGVAGITVNMTVDPTSGVSLTPAIATNDSGETSALLKSYARAPGELVRVVGTVSVTSSLGDTTLSDTAYIEFAALENAINSVNVWAEPPTLTVTPGASASSLIQARVLDVTNTAIQDLQVSFTSSKGALTQPLLTDSTGVASVTFYSNGDTGQVKIWATAGTFVDSTVVSVNQSASATGTIFITSDKNFIYADGNVTHAIIWANLRNADNEPIVGDTVKFTSYPPYTKIASPRPTDSTGTAESTFDDLGAAFYTEPDSAMIIAKYDALGLSDTCYITIKEAPLIDHIVLTSPATTGLEASGRDTAEVNAQIFLENNNFAPEGTPITFETTLGSLVPTDTLVGQNGQAKVKLVSAAAVDTAFVTATAGDVESNTLIIPFIPGNPTDIVLTSTDPDTHLVVGGPSGTIVVTVQDTTGNGVPGKQVSWETSLGTINSMSITNNVGQATAYLSPQTEAGVAQISAYTAGVGDTLRFGYLIMSGYPSSITLSASTNSIHVQGTGGQEAAALTAAVFDPNGNPVPDEILVAFELLAPVPEGAHFDNGLQMDSSFTSNGTAMVSLNSGLSSGPVKVQAVTWMDWPSTNNPISATKSNLVIASGPPHSIDIDYNSDPSEALGEPTAALKIGVSARIQDIYGNNVSEGTAVFFSVDPETLNIWHGPYAHVIGSASVVDSSGVAYNNLYYNSEATFKKTTLVAECVGAGVVLISDEAIVTLPLFGGEVQLEAVPNAWYFGNTGIIKVVATVKDDLLNPINNAKVIFNNSGGLYFNADSIAAGSNLTPFWNQQPIWRFEQYSGPTPIDSINYSSLMNDFIQENGQAILFMRAEELELSTTPIYPGVFVDNISSQVVVEVSAALTGSEVSSDPENVTFRRFP